MSILLNEDEEDQKNLYVKKKAKDKMKVDGLDK
jgi:hypothetical protein